MLQFGDLLGELGRLHIQKRLRDTPRFSSLGAGGLAKRSGGQIKNRCAEPGTMLGEIDLAFASGGEDCDVALGVDRYGYVRPGSAGAAGQDQERKRRRTKKASTQAARSDTKGISTH
jgi:hypothetical protein